MNDRSADAPLNVLIAGGGVAALEALIALRTLAGDLATVELLAPDRTFEHLPMLVAAPFGKGETHEIDVSRVAREQGARHRLDALAEVQAPNRKVITHSGEEIDYDTLLVATGARRLPGLEGALTLATKDDARAVRRLVEQLGNAGEGSLAFVLPSGVNWSLPMYELALMTSLYLVRRSVTDVELSLVTTEDGDVSEAEPVELTGWPPAKIEARYLAPYLATREA